MDPQLATTILCVLCGGLLLVIIWLAHMIIAMEHEHRIQKEQCASYAWHEGYKFGKIDMKKAIQEGNVMIEGIDNWKPEGRSEGQDEKAENRAEDPAAAKDDRIVPIPA